MALQVRSSILLALVIACLVLGVHMQEIGVDICHCQPGMIKLQFDFSINCADSNIQGPGIEDTSCSVNQSGNRASIPILITQVQISELDQQLAVFEQSTLEGMFDDGQNIAYTSVVLQQPDRIDLDTLPRAFQVVLTGINANGKTIENTVTIEYSNECGIIPLIEVGRKIGWLKFIGPSVPVDEFCPIANPSSTDPPTISASLPSKYPSTSPISRTPSNNPSMHPSYPPTSEHPSANRGPNPTTSEPSSAIPTFFPSKKPPSLRPSFAPNPLTGKVVAALDMPATEHPSTSPSFSSESPSLHPLQNGKTAEDEPFQRDCHQSIRFSQLFACIPQYIGRAATSVVDTLLASLTRILIFWRRQE